MFFSWPAGHVGAELADQMQRSLRTDGIDLTQVGTAGEPMQGAADIELGLMFANLPTARRGQW